MSITTLFAAAAISLAAFLPAEAAVVHIVNGNGQLTGATGVDVDGSLYDVSFVDGSCEALFTNCDPNNGGVPFAFTTHAGAIAAAQALLDQVFLDGVTIEGVTYNFDSQPALTDNCTQPTVCFATTPYEAQQTLIVAWNARNGTTESTDYVTLSGNHAAFNPGTLENRSYAVWTPSNMSAVPLPAGLPLLLAGLAGLTGLRVTGKRRGRF